MAKIIHEPESIIDVIKSIIDLIKGDKKKPTIFK